MGTEKGTHKLPSAGKGYKWVKVKVKDSRDRYPSSSTTKTTTPPTKKRGGKKK